VSDEQAGASTGYISLFTRWPGPRVSGGTAGKPHPARGRVPGQRRPRAACTRKQDALIAEMSDREALILYPIGKGNEMSELEACAEKRLGKRCIIMRRTPPQRSDYERYLPREILADLSLEVMRAYVEFGYSWLPRGGQGAVRHRAYAFDIEEELRRRGLMVDPATVVAEAFGEGFEACAMTWKGMLATYLGGRIRSKTGTKLSVSGPRSRARRVSGADRSPG